MSRLLVISLLMLVSLSACDTCKPFPSCIVDSKKLNPGKHEDKPPDGISQQGAIQPAIAQGCLPPMSRG